MVQNVVSNWGRWGANDQLGALNLLTPEVVLKAVGLVRKGRVYSLAVPLEKDGPQHPSFHKTWKASYSIPDESGIFSEDVLTMETHSGTHIDALGHMWAEGRFYNDIPEDEAFDSGVVKTGIENVRSMVGRGVMLDVPAYRNVDHMGPGEVVAGEELDAVAAAQGSPGRAGRHITDTHRLV